MIRFFKFPGVVMIFHKSRQYSIRSSDDEYDEIVDLLKKQTATNNLDREILSMILSPDLMKEFLESQKSEFSFSFKGDDLYINGERVESALASRIRDLRRQNKTIEPLLNFLRNVKDNPNPYSIKELYEFLERNDLPITEDGHFLAYKKVDENYKDCYSHTFDNRIGKTVQMDRAKCDPNRNNTCSHGLHFASYDYMSQYSGEHIIIVKINPRDVVSFPTDYGLSKGRCCRYEVVGEVDDSKERIRAGAVDTKTEKLTTKTKKSVAKKSEDTKKKSLKDYPKSLAEFLMKQCRSLGTKVIEGRTVYIIANVPRGKNMHDIINLESKKNPEIDAIFNHYKIGRSSVKNPINSTTDRTLYIKVNTQDYPVKCTLLCSKL